MERRQRNNGLTMITFHSRQTDLQRRIRKKHTLAHFKFTSRIALPNCTVIFTKHEKSCATVYQAQCKRTSWNCPFMQNKPYPLSKQGFYGSLKSRQRLREGSGDGHAITAKHLIRHPAKFLATNLHHVSAMAGQWQRQRRRMSVRMTCKTTHPNLTHDIEKL
jgi:hypothetical protein